MTEDEYIKTKALGTITSAINALNDITTQPMGKVMQGKEYMEVMTTLRRWQSRIFAEIEVKNNP